MQTQNDRTVDALTEQLIESGCGGLAAALAAMLNLAMRMERERANGALAYERSAARTACANGYKPKKTGTPAGTLSVQVPKSRGRETLFYPQALERGLRSCRAVMPAVAQMYVHPGRRHARRGEGHGRVRAGEPLLQPGQLRRRPHGC